MWSSRSEPPSHRRSQSAPPINVEDHSSPPPEPEQDPRGSGAFNPSGGRVKTDPLEDHIPQHPSLHPHVERDRWGHKKGSWGRKRSPGVEWKQKWGDDTWKNGRVLLIDYMSREHTKDGKRRIAAEEFRDVEGLRHFYRYHAPKETAALRVIHVQNAPWATAFLLRKFYIDHHDEMVGTSFGRWAKYDRPQLRAGKPVLKGKTFRTERDPWRGISRTGFALDYLKHYKAGSIDARDGTTAKMMELNDYDALENPNYAYDVYVQRLSVYIQRNDGEIRLPDDPEIRSPYNYEQDDFREHERLRNRYSTLLDRGKEQEYIPRLKSLDNGSTIIIFENSLSGSVNDTLIGAREEIESRWRRLTFYLPRDEVANDERLATQCMDLVLKDIFKGLSEAWVKYITMCETHVGILEDKIYESPADESRAPELWSNSNLWLKVEKLIFIHIDVIKETMEELKQVSDDLNEWLGSTHEEYERLASTITEDLVKPTDSLSDLMYKSVEIRDSRHSIQLSSSMWRISWLTFIFLPLLAVASLFGMNVDTFKNDPSIKWYFIAAVPFMVFIIVIWYLTKHLIARRRADPVRRGVYENLYHDLTDSHPELWSRNGPLETVNPNGFVSNIKWNLLTIWFTPEKTILAQAFGADDLNLGAWGRFKRRCARVWLKELRVGPPRKPLADAEALLGTELDEIPTIGSGSISDLTAHHGGNASSNANSKLDVEQSPPNSNASLRPARPKPPQSPLRPGPISDLVTMSAPVLAANGEATAALGPAVAIRSRARIHHTSPTPSTSPPAQSPPQNLGANPTAQPGSNPLFAAAPTASANQGSAAVRPSTPGSPGGADDLRRPSSPGSSGGMMIDEAVGSDDELSSDGGRAEAERLRQQEKERETQRDERLARSFGLLRIPRRDGGSGTSSASGLGSGGPSAAI